MSTPKKTTGCPRWCEYRDGGAHPINHRRHLGEVLLNHDQSGVLIAVSVESPERSTSPYPVLDVLAKNDGPAHLDLEWGQVDRLAALLTTARRRYAV